MLEQRGFVTVIKSKGEDLGNFPPGMAQPALRALHGAGYTRLEQLAKISEADLKKLHGIGPNALKKLGEALKEKGLSFAD